MKALAPGLSYKNHELATIYERYPKAISAALQSPPQRGMMPHQGLLRRRSS
jgi:hypothetical protein